MIGSRHEPHKYRVGNITFVVTPVFKEDRGETLFSILLRLMKTDIEKD